jgi:hypothetical protein
LKAEKPQPIHMTRNRFKDLKDFSDKSANNIFLRRSVAWFTEGHYAITEYSEFLNYWLSFETILGIIENLRIKEAYTIVIFVYSLAEKPKYLKSFLQRIQDPKESKILEGDGMNARVISILRLVSGGSLRITINYIYARRNSLVHEGETFSFELGALSRILEVYAQVMIDLCKEY